MSLQFKSCSDIALICPCLKNPTFVRSFHANFPSSECLVHRWRSVLKRSHACSQLLIVVFNSSTRPAPSNFYSLSSTLWTSMSAVSTECRSSTTRLTVLGASLICRRSSRSSRVPCKAAAVIPTTPAAMLRGSDICVC